MGKSELCAHCEVRKVPQGDYPAAKTKRRLSLCSKCYKSPKARAERQRILHIKPGKSRRKGEKVPLFEKLDAAFEETLKLSTDMEKELQGLLTVTNDLTRRGTQHVFQLRERIERGRAALGQSVTNLTTANAGVRRELKRVVDMRTGVDKLLEGMDTDEGRSPEGSGSGQAE